MSGPAAVTQNGPTPRYRRVKEFIVRHIEAGDWRAGDQVPSESALVKQLKVSRMTVNRALRELTHEGLIVRVQGTGTFVAEKRPIFNLVELRNIAEEIAERGQRHTARVELLKSERATLETARDLGLNIHAVVYHSVLVHMADGVPLQVEDRFVNPATAQGYLGADFTTITPNEFLMQTAPATEVEHIVEAAMPDARIRKLLKIGGNEPCLRLRRRTWSGSQIVSAAVLWHPGHAHRFTTRFSYRADGTSKRTYL
ncbi:MAG: histidine utilization repressor [Ferrovibrio sp.]|uniref:histidine utilization repressor n=1 Tax=Ferrovibrio sp. TaxID=1917215 RepID=UPI00260B9278|nr:histidine utilization repressor [Ferrovibrio sp.]MCW0234910.1 histidine utilization repressor [Ferrovibrio sp.]